MDELDREMGGHDDADVMPMHGEEGEEDEEEGEENEEEGDEEGGSGDEFDDGEAGADAPGGRLDPADDLFSSFGGPGEQEEHVDAGGGRARSECEASLAFKTCALYTRAGCYIVASC